MKRILSLILTVAMCFTFALSLASCDTETEPPAHTHSYKTEWTHDNENHWHDCTGTDCKEVSDKAAHTFASDTCSVCGYKKPEEAIPLTKAQWDALFTLDNVTVTEYELDGADKTLVTVSRLDGNKCLMTAEGITVPYDEMVTIIRMMLNFSSCYSSLVYEGGKYKVASFDPAGDGSYVYENAVLTVENGVLTSISSTVKEKVPQYNEYYEPIGTTIETREVLYEFSDYGTTDATPINSLPISVDEWKALFDESKYQNVKIDMAFSSNAGGEPYSQSQTIYYANGIERVSMMLPEMVGIMESFDYYNINGVWYSHYKVAQEYGGQTVTERTPGAPSGMPTFNSLISELFSTYKNDMIYYLVTYDQTEDEYTVNLGNESVARIKISNGRIASLQMTVTEPSGGYTYNGYTFSGFGTTTVNVPFNPNDIP